MFVLNPGCVLPIKLHSFMETLTCDLFILKNYIVGYS